MAITYFPFDNVAAYEAQWMELMRPLMGAQVIRTNRSHVDLNLFEVYGDSSGMQVKVKSGSAHIEGFYVNNSAEVIKSISTSDPTNPRIDRVILKLDRTANTITLEVKTGTPAGSPVAPTLTQADPTWEMTLAQVYVGAGVSTITSGNVTDERTFTSYRMVKSLDTQGYRAVGVTHTPSDVSVITGDGKAGITIPHFLNGYNIIDVIATVHTQGVTNTTDVQIRRRRSGSDVDVLSTKITIGAEYYARDGVINASNDDVATGDLIFVDVDAIHTTAPKGLAITISLVLP